MPSRDVDITYRITRAHATSIRERVRWSAREHLERIDGPDKATTIVDRKANEVTLLIPKTRTYRKLDDPPQGPIGVGAGAVLTRRGDARVAGLPCTEWSWTESDELHSVCVTSDGVVLRHSANGSTVAEALSVKYRDQASDLFEVPPNYLPALAPEGAPGL